jgi:adenine-specific DNA methylase
MVCRKRSLGADGRPPIGDYGKVREEIRRRVEEALLEFWAQGIAGADFFMAAIGPAVEAFGRYSRVEKLSGEAVSVGELLELARQVSSEFALSRILRNGHLAGVDPVTQFYLLWRWSYPRGQVLFDEARKLAQARGVDLEALVHMGLMKKSGEYVRLLSTKERAWREERAPAAASGTNRNVGQGRTMIDALQRACLLWERGEKAELDEILRGTSEAFWQVAQALASVLPEGDKERQLLFGLLSSQRKMPQEGPSLFDGS